jgi:hypothetical protein
VCDRRSDWRVSVQKMPPLLNCRPAHTHRLGSLFALRASPLLTIPAFAQSAGAPPQAAAKSASTALPWAELGAKAGAQNQGDGSLELFTPTGTVGTSAPCAPSLSTRLVTRRGHALMRCLSPCALGRSLNYVPSRNSKCALVWIHIMPPKANTHCQDSGFAFQPWNDAQANARPNLKPTQFGKRAE